jgi:4-amino-4-deoxy-L-arabinose transferase-like glycosyltransferase
MNDRKRPQARTRLRVWLLLAVAWFATSEVSAVFGAHELAPRLSFSALTFLWVPLTFLIARWLYRSERVGTAAAAALAVNPYFVVVGQLNLLDSGLFPARVEPWWFFVPCVLIATLPWLGSAFECLRSLRRGSPASWVLAIFCLLVFAFFSVSPSKRLPDLLPMMPALAVLLAPHIALRDGSPVRAARIIAVVVTVIGVGACIFVAHERHVLALPMVAWVAVAAAVAAAAALITRTNAAWFTAALGSILSVQALMMAYASLTSAGSAV